MLSTGLSRRSLEGRLASGRIEAIHRGIYRIPGSPPSWQQKLLAACLWADGTASHRAAARLWQLEGSWRPIVEITTSRRLEPSSVTRHMTRLDQRDVTSIGPLPVTTVVRTLLDLGAVIPRPAVEAAVSDALRRGLVTTERLRRCLEEAGGRGRRGAKVLRSILESLGEQRPESVLELKLIRLIRRSGLPEPVPQYTIRREGKVVARVDLAYPSIRLA